MSRIGRKPIEIPAGVDVKVNGHEVVVKGPKGALDMTFHPEIGIALEGNEIIVSRPSEDKMHKSLHLSLIHIWNSPTRKLRTLKLSATLSSTLSRK